MGFSPPQRWFGRPVDHEVSKHPNYRPTLLWVRFALHLSTVIYLAPHEDLPLPWWHYLLPAPSLTRQRSQTSICWEGWMPRRRVPRVGGDPRDLVSNSASPLTPLRVPSAGLPHPVIWRAATARISSLSKPSLRQLPEFEGLKLSNMAAVCSSNQRSIAAHRRRPTTALDD